MAGNFVGSYNTGRYGDTYGAVRRKEYGDIFSSILNNNKTFSSTKYIGDDLEEIDIFNGYRIVILFNSTSQAAHGWNLELDTTLVILKNGALVHRNDHQVYVSYLAGGCMSCMGSDVANKRLNRLILADIQSFLEGEGP